MVASPILLFLSLATVGADGDAARIVPLTGNVVGADGRPAGGAEVVASVESRVGDPPASIGRARADAGGRFVMPLSDDPARCDRPTLWAYLPGSVVGSIPIDRDAPGGRPVRLTLGSPARSKFVVTGPDGRPIAGARVIPRTVAREVADLPEALAVLASSTTDAEGRAVVSAFRPEELVGVRVEASGFGIQPREFRSADGLAEVGEKSITLLACGRVSGRVVAEDPKAAAGLTVRVVSEVGGRGGASSGLAETSTDAAGRFEVPSIASGSVTVRVRPREGSPDLPARVVRRTLEEGRGIEVEVPLRRGVRVAGLVVDDRDGRPVAGAMVSVVPSGPAEPRRVRSDAEGRFEAFVPAGLVSHRVLKVPAPYLCPPPFVGPRPIEVPPAIARFELPKISLTRGVDLRGTVVDEGHRPLSGARVEASWMMFDGRIRAPRSESSTSQEDGSFVLGPVAPDVELAVVASNVAASTREPFRVRASDPKPVELTLAEGGAVALDGRVVGPDARGIAGASVGIWSVARSHSGSIEGNTLLRFDGSDGLKTDTEGRFATPGRLRIDREYRAVASADGHLPRRTPPLRPRGAGSSTFPDLVLPAEARRVAIDGRVLDGRGRPLAGARVRTSADGPRGRWASTDLDGRFRLPDVPDGRGFLFAEADGFRFLGREFEPGVGPFDLVLTRVDEDPAVAMKTLSGPSAGPALARRVMAPYVDRVLSEGDHSTRIRTLELLARVDPGRVLALIEARGVQDLWFADHLRHAALCGLEGSDSDGKLAIVGQIGGAEWRVMGALDAADALPQTARALKREWVERAWRDAPAIREPSRRVVALAGVARRLIDLDEPDRARRLLDEARSVAESLPLATSGGPARVEVAECLARLDPAGALALTEDLVDPAAFDRCRIGIARQLAGRDPALASRVLESLRDPRSLVRALPALCHALAPVDPTLARQWLARARSGDSCSTHYALGMMALAISGPDKPTATRWLRETFDRLGQVAASGPPAPGAWQDPAAVAAALLPVAERIDPALLPEFFWRAVSFHSPRPGVAEARSKAALALLLARYDRTVARSILEPWLARALDLPEADLDPLITAAAILDPSGAVRLVEGLPEAPDLTFHHPKNQARLALAAALVRKAPACWDDATSRLLHLWSDGAPAVE